MTSSDENRSSGSEHTVRSLISVVHDAVRRNITADDDSESATLTFHRCCQSRGRLYGDEVAGTCQVSTGFLCP